jgi:hypothetical protein
MSIAFLFHAVSFLVLIAITLVLLAFAARFAFRRRIPATLDHVAMFVRWLDVLELAALLDPKLPRTLRRDLSDQDYRRELEVHIRLVHEYLQRVDHNVRTIQNWVAGEYTGIAEKPAKDYTADDQLVVEAQRIAKKLRRYVLAASLKLWIWEAFRVDRWPVRFLPSIPNLRVLNGVNLVASYIRLSGITRSLALQHGGRQQEAIFEALLAD